MYFLKLLKTLPLNVTGKSKQYPEGLLVDLIFKRKEKDAREKGVFTCRPQFHARFGSVSCLPLTETELLS